MKDDQGTVVNRLKALSGTSGVLTGGLRDKANPRELESVRKRMDPERLRSISMSLGLDSPPPNTGPLNAKPTRIPVAIEQPVSQKVFEDDAAFKVAVNNIDKGPLTKTAVSKRTKRQLEAMKMPKTGEPTPRSQMDLLTGPGAVKKVEADLGRKLSMAEKRVVEVEGYVPHGYYDSKGNRSYGVGQTGEHIGDDFTSSFNFHVDRAKGRIGEKLWESLPEHLTTELTQGEYRGDLGLSPKTIRLIKGGEFDSAATEFLNNDEYKSTKTEQGVKDRMKAISDALRAHSILVSKRQPNNS